MYLSALTIPSFLLSFSVAAPVDATEPKSSLHSHLGDISVYNQKRYAIFDFPSTPSPNSPSIPPSKNPSPKESPKFHPHTTYPEAHLYCPPQPTTTKRRYKVHLDTDYTFQEHMAYLNQRLDGSKVQLHYELKNAGTVYIVELQDEGVLDVIRNDPGIWFVECGSGEW